MIFKQTIIILVIIYTLDITSSKPLDENAPAQNITSEKLTKKQDNKKHRPKQDPGDFITVKPINKATKKSKPKKDPVNFVTIKPNKAITKDTFLRDVETLVPKEQRKGIKILVKNGGVRHRAEQIGQGIRKQIQNIGLGVDRRQGRVEGDAQGKKIRLSKGVKQVGIRINRRQRTTIIVPRPLPPDEPFYYTDSPFYGFPPNFEFGPNTPYPNHLNPFDPRLTTIFQVDYRGAQTEGLEYEDQ